MSELTVLQSVKRWLPRTQKWLHRQVTALPDAIDTKVACREVLNLDDFRVPRIGTFEEQELGWQPADLVLDELRAAPLLDRLVEQWEYRRWVDWRSDFGADADIVHSHFGHVGWRDVEVARRIDARHVTTFYGYDCSLLPAQDERWHDRYAELFEQVDLVLCEGPHMKQTVVDLGCPADKIDVHHLGVDLDDLEFRTRRREPEDRPVRFLIASSFKPKKGIPDAIEALGRLKLSLDFTITLVGDSTHVERTQQEKARIEENIEEYGLADRVDHRGFLPYEELIDELLEHDVLVAPSRTSFRGDSEGGAPVTMIAAQATGMPVVSTTHADIPNVVIDEKTGYLSGERDVDTLTENLRRIVVESDEWPKMGEAAREHIEREFDADAQADKLATHYRRLSGAETGRRTVGARASAE